MNILAWFIFIAAALLEVGGDAVVRSGLRSHTTVYIVIGSALLASYGIVVNTVKWDFSRLMGIYVAIFALVSVLFGQFVFKEQIPNSTWLGLAVIIIGGLIIQLGHSR